MKLPTNWNDELRFQLIAFLRLRIVLYLFLLFSKLAIRFLKVKEKNSEPFKLLDY